MRTLLPGVTAERVPTSRLTVSVLSVAGRTGQPVLFVHGNVSSSLFWQPAMLGLPEGCRPLAVDLRGFGDTDPEPVDATRGLGDYADDLAAVIDALALTSVHLVGWSMRPGRRRVGRRLGAPRFRGPPGRARPGRGEPCVTAAGTARALREAAVRSGRTGHLRGVDALDQDR
jgi:hypothetical protein